MVISSDVSEMQSGRSPVLVHCAYIRQEVEGHHRWHSLYARRVTFRDIEQRGGVHVFHIERDCGIVKMAMYQSGILRNARSCPPCL
ncbi:hypothetical protein [Mycetohabitans sp. B4]|uniref:hypothetical protein n=1 Tax=Mycetohabitans sp. B4 TaxID=2841842 RepID=UPI001F2DF92A|nr:hypothetical protein [Mycetohabitans sp. B4]MCG1018784.1 hypothetical protein [Mycetohabitans sp. B4]